MLPTNQDETLLLHLNEAIATIRDKEQLFQTIARKLRLIFPFDMMGINIFDKKLLNKRLFFKNYTTANPPEPVPPGAEQFTPIAGSPVEQLLADPHIQHIELPDYVRQYADFEPFQRLLRQGILHLTMVPLWLNGRLMGYLILATARPPAYTTDDEALLEKISSLVAIAVNNSLDFEEVGRREQQRSLQLNITNALLSIKQREPLFRAIAEELSQAVTFHYFGIRVQRAAARGVYEGFAEFTRPPDDPHAPLLALDPNRFAGRESETAGFYNQVTDLLTYPGLYAGDDFRALAVRWPAMRYAYDEHHVRAMLVVPIWQRADGAAVLTLASLAPTGFGPADLATVQALVPQVALALENLFAFEQIEALKAQVEQERTYLIDEINTDRPADGLIGTSAALQQVRERIGQVADTDATVLITGETGTGKEVVARAVHQASPRRGRALVKLNCAALPAQLIESELFGHEKGAFTGAVERRIGKFELADGGTIFLDEVGELPLDLQAKLLRVLQEKEFERLGGNRVLTTDARVLAATNRVLEDEVRAGRFRADLYYRLNVFPIQLEPLRERPEDIAPLVQHYLGTLSKRLARPLRAIRPADLARLQAYPWPGNIRELEHVLEQAIIVSRGAWLEFGGFAAAPAPLALPPAAALGPPAAETPDSTAPLKTLREQERDHILLALRRTGGRVSGASGAAVLLDINPKTLEARMKKLGIRRTVVAE
ncbi:MAG: sigma 54-interacting transcriptional regulator [Janthinobacterium lividum]